MTSKPSLHVKVEETLLVTVCRQISRRITMIRTTTTLTVVY